MAAAKFGAHILTKSGLVDTTTALSGKKLIGIYFSAHWCPPCRGFTPVLAEFYEAIKKSRNDFEIIFVSSDQDEEQFKHYWATHPWSALPYDAREQKQELSDEYGVTGIPSFIVIDSAGKTITKNGRADVMAGRADPLGQLVKWSK